MLIIMTRLLVILSILGPSSVKGEAFSKRGAAYTVTATVPPLSVAGTVSWAYNWAMSEPGKLPAGVEFVPMLWGAHFDGWQASIERALSEGSKFILGFNEPDLSSQAGLSPPVAAGYYKTYISPFNSRAKLVSPAVTSSTSTNMGLQWLDEFMKACSSCSISVIAVHWYGDSADSFKSFVNEAVAFARSYGLYEVWITEFALNADINGVTDSAEGFIQNVIPWLDSQSFVTRYSYFMCAEGYLLSGGSLSGAGQVYVSSSTFSTSPDSSTSCEGSA